MPEYAPMLRVSYYAQNYAGIIRQGLKISAIRSEWALFPYNNDSCHVNYSAHKVSLP